MGENLASIGMFAGWNGRREKGVNTGLRLFCFVCEGEVKIGDSGRLLGQTVIASGY